MATAQFGTLLRHIHQLAVNPDARQGTDRQLIEDFGARRDEAAFTTLVARHGPMVLRVCRRVLKHEQDAEDAFQATFLVLARQTGSIRKREALANWLHGVAQRTAMKAKRSAARRRNHEDRLRERTPPRSPSPTWDEVQTVLDEEIQRLPATYRAAFLLCVLEGKSGAQAAAELGVKEGTVGSRLTRARQLLQQRLARRGIKLTAVLAALAVVDGAARAAVPAALAHVTIRSGLSVAAGEPAATIPSHVAALAAGVTRAMLLKKAKIAVVLVFAAGLLIAGAGAVTRQALAAAGPPESQKTEVGGQKPGPAAAKPPVEKSSDSIEVSGRVVDSDGRPVAGAKFAVIDDETGTPVPEIASDSQGRFTFRTSRPQPGRSPRPRQVVASAPGFGVDWVSEPRNDTVFHLLPDCPISGRVIDLQGRPVAGATVAVQDVRTGPAGAFDGMLRAWKKSADEQEQAAQKLDRHLWNRGGLGQVFHATTAADGTFALTGFGRDRVVTLLISAAGIADTFAAVATRPGFDPAGAPRSPLRLYPPELSLVVAPDKPMTGVVRDEKTKAPVPGVRVMGTSRVGELPQGSYLFHAWPTPAAFTDKEGRFTLRGLAKAPAYILVADPNEGTEHLHRFAEVADTDGFAALTCDLTLPRGVVLTGRVTDEGTGAGAPSRVFYRPLEQNALLDQYPGYNPPGLPAPWHRGRDTKTDPDGRYKITVMPGAGVVHVQAFGAYRTARATQQEIEEGIVDRQFGHFRTVGQGGMYNPEFMSAYKVIRPAATEPTATLDVTVRPAEQPKPDGGKGNKP
jgi:RNA polymerase sigma factor (sigma-70 family)